MKKKEKQEINKHIKIVEDALFDYSKLSPQETIEKLKSSKSGLTEKEIEKRLDDVGYNVVEANKPPRWYKILWVSFYNPFNMILIFLLIISWLTSDWETVIVMAVMVFLSTFLRFWQELKAVIAAETLKKLVNNKIMVTRTFGEGAEQLSKKIEVPVEEIVPGDIVNLAAGDMIPGDMRLISSKDLFITQSAMTGEALPVEKHEHSLITTTRSLSEIANPNNVNLSILDKQNLCFMGSTVVSGTAIGIVIFTGNQTYFGSMASNLLGKKPETAFDKGVNKVSKLLVKFMLVMVPIVFMLNGLIQHDWSNAFLFAISVAVGLTPEMLPMIVNAGLAKGAIAMAKKKTVVKQLSAIQNFGAIDVLCTDKTGTLTQDNVVLIKHIHPDGGTSKRVLSYAFLNSYFQTGLRNLLDKAVINKATDVKLNGIANNFTLIDEIPFDFVRRRMSVILKNHNNGEVRFICKGAVEEIFERCAYTEDNNGNIISLNSTEREKLCNLRDSLSEDGLRIIAVAHKKVVNWQKDRFNVDDERDLVFVGYIAFLDPPKDSAVAAIKKIQEHGIDIKVLTGDNALVAGKICRDVGLEYKRILTGPEMSNMPDEELAEHVKDIVIFAKLSPMDKARIVTLIKRNGHVVGFMGDGINDALALREADVGISVDTGVDLAKEAADIILLEKSLLVLEKGIVEGRKTFGNIMKYIKITASSNFGNVFSMMIASIFIPFLPMLPVEIMIQNLLYDISCIAVPWDKVDKSFLKKPRKWDAKPIAGFMVVFGPLSSIFDVVTFIVMWHVFKANSPDHQALFQTGWFVVGLTTQTLILHFIRTEKLPFIQSRAAFPLMFTTFAIIILGILLPFTGVGEGLGMVALPISYFFWLVGIDVAYALLTQAVKVWYIKRFKSLI